MMQKNNNASDYSGLSSTQWIVVDMVLKFLVDLFHGIRRKANYCLNDKNE